MRVGLDREETPVDRRDARQCAGAGAHHVQVVDVARCARLRQRQQVPARSGCAPPAHAAMAHGPVDLAPTGSEHAGLVGRHGTAVDQGLVQQRQHALGIGLVDHEGQVEVVGRLRDQVHAFAAEHGPDIGQLVQQRAHAAPDQGDGRAWRDHLHPADLGQVGRQRGQHVGADQVLAGVQRHGDVGLRRTDQVHRQAMLLETGEHVGQEADLLPHADAFHRHQHDAVAAADGLYARHGQGIAVDGGPRQVRALGIEDRHGHAGVAAGLDGTGVQHLRAGGRDFLRFVVIQPRQQSGIGHFARVRAEHAGHIGPDLNALRTQQCAEVGGGGIRTTAPEDGGAAIGMPGDEALRQQHGRRLAGERAAPVLVRRGVARHRQSLRPRTLVGQEVRLQPVAGVHPAEIQPLRAQIGHTEGGREQLALRQHLGLPVQRAGRGTRIDQQVAQRRQAVAEYGIGIQLQFDKELAVALFQFRHALGAVGRAVGDGGQLVGDAGQRRHHHQHANALLVRPLFRQFADRVPAMAARHRGAAELEDDPTIRRGSGRRHG